MDLKKVLAVPVFVALLVLVGILGIPSFTYAQESSSSVVTLTREDLIASVNAENFKIKSQQNNAFNLGFDITNAEGVQPKVIYAVNLLKKDNTSIVDQKVYDNDTLNLNAGESVRKDVTYIAPVYLNGTYVLEVQIRNPDGLLLATVRSPEVTLNGNEENISLNSDSCFLTIDEVKGRFSMSQGVDISPEETLTAHCPITSNFTSDTIVTPVFETRYRSTFGKVMGTERLANIMFTPGQAIDFITKIPKMTEPQAYDAVLTFTTANGEHVSAPADVHYVLRGASATIRNTTLDKDYYARGDTVNLWISWSGPADGFPDSRMKPTEVPKGTLLSVFITNDRNKSCVADFSRQLDMAKGGGVEHLSLSVTNNCQNPSVTVKITDTSGKVLAENSYKISSKRTSVFSGISTSDYLLFGSIFLIMLALLSYFIKSRKNVKTLMFFVVLVCIATFYGGERVNADTYNLSTYVKSYGGFEGNFATNFTINLVDPVTLATKRTYYPGETITARGTFSAAACNNTIGGQISVRINGLAKWIEAGTWQIPDASNPEHKVWVPSSNTSSMNPFTAPTTPGTYTATFYGYYSVYQPSSYPACSSWVVNNLQCGSNFGTEYLVGQADYAYTVLPASSATSFSSVTVTVAPSASCSIWGGSVSSGNSVTAYQAPSVASPSTCTFETRSCNNGTLSGSYTNQNCTVVCTNGANNPTACNQCPDGLAYKSQSCVACGGNPAPTGCTGAGGNSGSPLGSLVCINGATNPTNCNAFPPAQPVITSFSASPATIDQGQSSTLSWNSNNASSCTGTGFLAGSPSGSRSTGVINTPGVSTYQLICSGLGGDSSIRSAPITVLSPSVSISASPSRVRTGTPSTITWSASQVVSCTVSGPGLSRTDYAETPTSQNVTIPSQSVFTITCQTNGGRTITGTAIVNVTSALREF